jgi:ABC-2 type transport system ATP-binding protein
MKQKKTYIKLENISKIYHTGQGIFDVSFEVFPSEIVGFIGPNGAGKSTTMRVIMGLTRKNKGSLSLFDQPINSEADLQKIMPKLGYLPAEGGLYENITPKRLFNYSASLYKKNLKSEMKKYSEILKLSINTKINQLSLGNKKKVGILQALMHNPKLLILDEPTSGLDPLTQQEIFKMIKEVKRKGGSVLLSSHNLSEVQSVCDRIIMIKQGKIIYTGDIEEILEKAVKVIRVSNLKERIEDKLADLPTVRKMQEIGSETVFYTVDTKPIIDYLISKNIYDFYVERPTLEERFLDFY